jgi:hypothetical protein
MTLKTWVGIAGIAGFLLSLANAVQTWRRNRPIVSVHPGQHPTEAIEIEIEKIRRFDRSPSSNHNVFQVNCIKYGTPIGRYALKLLRLPITRSIELFRAWQSNVSAFYEPRTAALC